MDNLCYREPICSLGTKGYGLERNILVWRKNFEIYRAAKIFCLETFSRQLHFPAERPIYTKNGPKHQNYLFVFFYNNFYEQTEFPGRINSLEIVIDIFYFGVLENFMATTYFCLEITFCHCLARNSQN